MLLTFPFLVIIIPGGYVCAPFLLKKPSYLLEKNPITSDPAPFAHNTPVTTGASR